MTKATAQSCRILIADAEPGRRGEVVRLVQENGYRLLEARDGPEALRLLRQGAADAALVDSRLPGLTGVELLQQLRASGRTPPVVLVAAPGSVREAVVAMENGARNYLTRPIAPEELTAALRDALRPRLSFRDPRAVVPARESDDQARQVHKLEVVGRLAGGVAHDFNNLLTVINGYAEILRGGLGPDHPLRPYAEEILRAVERGAGVTRQLLAFSRKQVVQPVVLDLNRLVVNMEKMLRPLIGEHIELALELVEGPCPIKADPGQIEQVVVNLAVNARDAMPHGGRLSIRTHSEPAAGASPRLGASGHGPPMVTLAVSDSGCGMDEETQAHIFEPFFTTKEAGKGTGLGLATVHGIVEQCGGHIEVRSDLGRGTTFTIALPRAAEASLAVGSPGAHLAAPRGVETVLLMEDEESVRVVVRRVLEMHGYTVLEPCNPEEAFACAVGHPGPIHLLVTDVVMPQMTGYELARRLTQVRPSLRVLYITGYTQNPAMSQLLLEENAALLPKPFSPGPLARKVREVLDRR